MRRALVTRPAPLAGRTARRLKEMGFAPVLLPLSETRPLEVDAADIPADARAIAARAKGPAMAGGAALVGLAGGLALSRNKRRNGILGRIPTPNVSKPKLSTPKVSMPKVKPDEALKTIGKAAGEVAQRSQRIGAVASEVQKASDALEKRR